MSNYITQLVIHALIRQLFSDNFVWSGVLRVGGWGLKAQGYGCEVKSFDICLISVYKHVKSNTDFHHVNNGIII